MEVETGWRQDAAAATGKGSRVLGSSVAQKPRLIQYYRATGRRIG